MSEPTITYEDRNLASKIFACPDHFKLPAIAEFREAAYEAGKLAGAKAMQVRAVNHCKAGAANARIDVIIERYGDEATQHAADLLNAEAEELSRIDPATIAKEAL